MKTAWITGASHGIGKAISKKLAAEGYQLALNCNKSAEALIQFCTELEKEYHVPILPLIGDVGDCKSVEQMYRTLESFFGGTDLLINNAGISHVGLLSELSSDEWNRILAVNLSSVFYCCKAAIPHMVHQKSGKILNISSVWGEAGASCEAAYSASKGGMNALTRALAKELAPSNIQVNAIACGCIDTRMNDHLNAEERACLENEIPSGRYGTPEETADFAWSILNGNNYLTGQVIRFDGGWI